MRRLRWDGETRLHLFAIATDVPSVRAEDLQAALLVVADAFKLDPGTAWTAASSGGGLLAAGVHHGAQASPRRYVSREGEQITIVDGLPVDPSGRHLASDAAVLAGGWDGWATELEGQFCVGRIDLVSERAELMLDTFGLIPAFAARHRGGLLVSNSVAVIRSLLGCDAPDPLAVSSMVALGWAMARKSLLDGVTALSGGSRHELRRGTIVTRTHFSTGEILKRPDDMGPDELVSRMATTTASALTAVAPVRCAITAGRDSRMAVALVRASGVEASYYTIGDDDDRDVVWGRALSERFGLPFESLGVSGSADVDWIAAADLLVRQTDGLSDLSQMIDYRQPSRSPGDSGSTPGIGVKVSGVGGEIGRNGPYDNAIAAGNVPFVGAIAALQRRILAMKGDAHRDLLTPAASDLLDSEITAFFDARLAEGWRSGEVADVFFAFERVGCFAATAPRRAAAWDDFFSPFCSRAYAEYCLGMSPAERYVELPFHQILRRVSPDLYRFPYESPLLSPNPRRAPMRAMRKVAGYGLSKLASRRRPDRGPACESPFLAAWIESSRPVISALLDEPDSRLWEIVSRERTQALIAASSEQRAAKMDGLLRVMTVFSYFHGPLAAISRV